MFYFGGMTLGYLTPPDRKAGSKKGEIVVESRQNDLPADQVLPLPDHKTVPGRKLWFGLNG